MTRVRLALYSLCDRPHTGGFSHTRQVSPCGRDRRISAWPLFILSLAAMRCIPDFRQSPRLLPALLQTRRRVAVTDNISAFATQTSLTGRRKATSKNARSGHAASAESSHSLGPEQT